MLAEVGTEEAIRAVVRHSNLQLEPVPVADRELDIRPDIWRAPVRFWKVQRRRVSERSKANPARAWVDGPGSDTFDDFDDATAAASRYRFDERGNVEHRVVGVCMDGAVIDERGSVVGAWQ